MIHTVTALLLVAAPTTPEAPVPRAAPAAVLAGDSTAPQECYSSKERDFNKLLKKAKENKRKNRETTLEDYRAISDIAEDCSNLVNEDDNAYYVGIAYLEVGRPDRAIDTLQPYIEKMKASVSGLLPEAEEALQLALAQGVWVDIKLPPKVTSAQVKMDLLYKADRKTVLARDLEQQNGRLRLWLAPGTNELYVSGEGLQEKKYSLEIVAGKEEEILLEGVPAPAPNDHITPPPAPGVLPPKREYPSNRGAVYGVGYTLGGVGLAAGLTTLTIGIVRSGKTLNVRASDCEPGPDLHDCRFAYAQATGLRGVGAGVLGGAGGLLVGIILTYKVKQEKWRGLGIAEASVGGVLAVVGAVLVNVGLRNYAEINTDSSEQALLWGDEFRRKIAPHAHVYGLGSGLLGAGFGLVTSGVAHLAWWEKNKRAARAPLKGARLSPHAQGIALHF